MNKIFASVDVGRKNIVFGVVLFLVLGVVIGIPLTVDLFGGSMLTESQDAFNMGFPWLQELYVWQHAAVFMAGAGYTLLHRGHVNVDVLYGRLNDRRRVWIDIFGTLLFLFPWLAVVAVTSAPFVTTSWSIREGAATADGMPAVYLLKSLLWVFCALLFLQGLALIARRALYLGGRSGDPAFTSLVAQLDRTYPWYAPGRFLKAEYQAALSMDPRLLQQSSFTLAGDDGGTSGGPPLA